MAVVNRKSDVITAIDGDVRVKDDVRAGTRVMVRTGVVSVLDGDSTDSTYRIMRIKSNDRICMQRFGFTLFPGCDSLSVGLYDIPDLRGNEGLVVTDLRDPPNAIAFFADVYAPNDDPAGSATHETMGTVNFTPGGNPSATGQIRPRCQSSHIFDTDLMIFERLGLAEDPRLSYDMTLTLQDGPMTGDAQLQTVVMFMAQ